MDGELQLNFIPFSTKKIEVKNMKKETQNRFSEIQHEIAGYKLILYVI